MLNLRLKDLANLSKIISIFITMLLSQVDNNTIIQAH